VGDRCNAPPSRNSFTSCTINEIEISLMLDTALSWAHHLAVFTLTGLLFAEAVLLVRGLGAAQARRLGMIDALFGASAIVVVVAGVLRVLYGLAGWEYYVGNYAFWTKMGLFVIVGLLSIAPTISIARWRRVAKSDPRFVAADTDVARVRNFIVAEFIVLAFIPLAAIMMAPGRGG
jgi:putative membrane protein